MSIVEKYNEMVLKLLEIGKTLDSVEKELRDVVIAAGVLYEECKRNDVLPLFIGSRENEACAWAKFIYETGKVPEDIFLSTMKMLIDMYETIQVLKEVAHSMIGKREVT